MHWPTLNKPGSCIQQRQARCTMKACSTERLHVYGLLTWAGSSLLSRVASSWGVMAPKMAAASELSTFWSSASGTKSVDLSSSNSSSSSISEASSPNMLAVLRVSSSSSPTNKSAGYSKTCRQQMECSHKSCREGVEAGEGKQPSDG